MEVDKIKEYLVEELPEFNFMTGKEANQPEENHNSIRIEREEQELILDVSKVDNDKALENLKVYIEDLWKRYEKDYT